MNVVPTIRQIYFGAGETDDAYEPEKVEIVEYHERIRRQIIALIADAGDLDLPNLLIRYTVTGGTADAIVATPNLPVPDAPGEALYAIGIVADNTGPVTINGKPWRTNVGNEFVAGGIKAGGVYLFLDNGDHYRSITDQDVSALVMAAEEAADRAEEARDDIISLEYGLDRIPVTPEAFGVLISTRN